MGGAGSALYENFQLLRPCPFGNTSPSTRCPWGGFPGLSCLPGRTGDPAAPCGLWSSAACSSRCSSASPSSPWKVGPSRVLGLMGCQHGEGWNQEMLEGRPLAGSPGPRKTVFLLSLCSPSTRSVTPRWRGTFAIVSSQLRAHTGGERAGSPQTRQGLPARSLCTEVPPR